MNKYYYMAVTADKYELPICIEESAEELANKLGISKNTVFSQISLKKDGNRCGRRIIRIEA